MADDEPGVVMRRRKPGPAAAPQASAESTLAASAAACTRFVVGVAERPSAKGEDAVHVAPAFRFGAPRFGRPLRSARPCAHGWMLRL